MTRLFRSCVYSGRVQRERALVRATRCSAFTYMLYVEGLTSKVCTFLLQDLWLKYYYDMIVWFVGSNLNQLRKIFLTYQSSVVHVRGFNLDFK